MAMLITFSLAFLIAVAKYVGYRIGRRGLNYLELQPGLRWKLLGRAAKWIAACLWISVIFVATVLYILLTALRIIIVLP